MKTIIFKLTLALGHCGFFTYSGLRGCQPGWWPKARVLYPADPKHGVMNAFYSTPMAVGNAIDYAFMFNGTVVPVSAYTPP